MAQCGRGSRDRPAMTCDKKGGPQWRPPRFLFKVLSVTSLSLPPDAEKNIPASTDHAEEFGVDPAALSDHAGGASFSPVSKRILWRWSPGFRVHSCGIQLPVCNLRRGRHQADGLRRIKVRGARPDLGFLAPRIFWPKSVWNQRNRKVNSRAVPCRTFR